MLFGLQSLEPGYKVEVTNMLNCIDYYVQKPWDRGQRRRQINSLSSANCKKIQIVPYACIVQIIIVLNTFFQLPGI